MPAGTDILSSALTQLRAAYLHIPSGSRASHAVADVLAGIAGGLFIGVFGVFCR